jgi:hypothetical protein
MNRTVSAIYLVGHGPYRQPRLIEMQYLRILRYRNLLKDESEPHIFIDLNFPRSSDPLRPNELPEFARLQEAVKAKQYSAVYVDLEIGSGFKPYEFMFVPQLLEAAGAKVFNALYDDGDVLEAALKQRYGDHAHADEVDDASDFINFFPAYAGIVVERSLRELENQENRSNPVLEKIYRHVENLKKDSPYGSGRMPFIERGLEHEWYRRRSQQRGK